MTKQQKRAAKNAFMNAISKQICDSAPMVAEAQKVEYDEACDLIAGHFANTLRLITESHLMDSSVQGELTKKRVVALH